MKIDLNRSKKTTDLNQFEFKVYSQFGEDGIIQFIINNIDIKNKIFVEFGVENYEEANTRFLLENNNWKGLVIDSSKENIKHTEINVNISFFMMFNFYIKAIMVYCFIK